MTRDEAKKVAAALPGEARFDSKWEPPGVKEDEGSPGEYVVRFQVIDSKDLRPAKILAATVAEKVLGRSLRSLEPVSSVSVHRSVDAPAR